MRAGAAGAAALLCALTCSPAAASDTPLCDWLSGVGDSAQALADGQPERAEAAARRAAGALPHGGAASRSAAALGLALHARGAWAPAAEALEVALAPASAPARASLSYLRGEALLLAGDAPAAARVLGEAARAAGSAGSDHLAVGRRAAFLEGRALTAADLPEEALGVLEEALRRHPDAPEARAARLDLAAARRAAHDEAGAVALYREVWLSAEPPEADVAWAQLEAWRQEGGPVPAAAPEDRLLRGERLLAAARPEDALREGQAAGAEEAYADRAQALRALALSTLGRMEEAARTAAPLARAEEPSLRRTAQLVLARAAARAGRVDEAVALYREVAASTAPVPGLPAFRQRDLADEAAYLAAWLPYDAGDFARAAQSLDAFGRANPRSRRAEDALWFAAWSRVRLGRRADAVRALERLGTTPLADAAAYWEARLQPGQKRQRALLERASALGGDGWYGYLARARLAVLGHPLARPPRPPARPLPDLLDPAAGPALATATELLGLGLSDAALDELRELAGSPRARAAAAQLAQLAAFAGDAELPFRMARDHLGGSRRTLRWSHPTPHLELVEPAAAASGVDAALVLAVMRRESSFRRAIRSGAGAEGLLQLRPSTAERVATLLGLPPGASARLGEPGVNLPLGIHYLGLLAERFGEQAVALAGYNAGPSPAAEWARARAGMPLDEWVECIPFRETRQYLKVVIADWDVYRELRGEPPAPVDPARAVRAPTAGVGF